MGIGNKKVGKVKNFQIWVPQDSFGEKGKKNKGGRGLGVEVFVMTKAVSNREICFILAVLLFYKHGHIGLN